MREHATLKSFDLLLGLLARDLLGIVDQQADDLRIVDVTLPELLRKFMVPPHLLGQLAQLCQADAEALGFARLGPSLLPVRNATFVAIFLQECEDLCFCHGLPSSGWTSTGCATGSSESSWPTRAFYNTFSFSATLSTSELWRNRYSSRGRLRIWRVEGSGSGVAATLAARDVDLDDIAVVRLSNERTIVRQRRLPLVSIP